MMAATAMAVSQTYEPLNYLPKNNLNFQDKFVHEIAGSTFDTKFQNFLSSEYGFLYQFDETTFIEEIEENLMVPVVKEDVVMHQCECVCVCGEEC